MPTIERNMPTLSTVPERIMARDVLVTAAQLLALNATPQQLVPAPGASFALVFEGAAIHKPAGAAYAGIAGGEDLAVRYTDGSGTQFGNAETVGFLDQTTAQTRYMRPWGAASGVSDITPLPDAPLMLHILSGEITTGDAPLHVRCFYRIVQAAAFA